MKARVLASAVLAATVILGTAGCNLMAPQATTTDYEPSDGVSATSGDVEIRNALVVSNDGETGNLTLSAINNGPAQDLTVEYGAAGSRESVTIPLDEGMTVFGQGELDAIELPNLNLAVGSMSGMYFQAGTAPGAESAVTVLDSTLEEYAHLAPGDSTPSPRATVEPQSSGH